MKKIFNKKTLVIFVGVLGLAVYILCIINCSKFEYKPDSDCNNAMCICHVGKSQLISFDFGECSFEKLDAREHGYYISFNRSYLTCYSDGAVYRNQSKIAEVESIEPYGQYRAYETDRYHLTMVSKSIFYDDGREIYYCYMDNKPYLKDLY